VAWHVSAGVKKASVTSDEGTTAKAGKQRRANVKLSLFSIKKRVAIDTKCYENS